MTDRASAVRSGTVPAVIAAVLTAVLGSAVLAGCGARPAGPARATASGPAVASPGSASPTSAGVAVGAAGGDGTGGLATGADGSDGGLASDAADQTVPVPPQVTSAAVPFGSTAGAAGVAVTLTGADAVQGEARGAGEVAGPAARVTLTIANGGAQPVSLGAVTVDLRTADGASAPGLAGPDVAPFTGTIPPGGVASAAYVFELAPAQRLGVSVVVAYAPGLPAVEFVGSVS